MSLGPLNAAGNDQGMHGLILISAEGEVFPAWHHVEVPPKDAGRTLQRWIEQWQEQKSLSAQMISAECDSS